MQELQRRQGEGNKGRDKVGWEERCAEGRVETLAYQERWRPANTQGLNSQSIH